jgi:hypothetical protein
VSRIGLSQGPFHIRAAGVRHFKGGSLGLALSPEDNIRKRHDGDSLDDWETTEYIEYFLALDFRQRSAKLQVEIGHESRGTFCKLKPLLSLASVFAPKLEVELEERREVECMEENMRLDLEAPVEAKSDELAGRGGGAAELSGPLGIIGCLHSVLDLLRGRPGVDIAACGSGVVCVRVA